MTTSNIGKKVLYFPNSGNAIPNSNGMMSAPGFILQEFNNGDYFNLVLFVANPNGAASINVWSVRRFESFTSGPPEGTPYFIIVD